MRQYRTKIVFYVGNCELSCYSPWMEKEKCDQLSGSLDDWTQFIEDIFEPIVKYRGDKTEHKMGFYIEQDSCGFEEEDVRF